MTLLSHYFQPDTDPAVVRAMAGDWLELLSPYPQGAVAEACRQYLMDEPRVRPTPGAIRGLVLKAMKSDPRLAPPALPKPPEPERQRVTPEAAARILVEAGLTPQRLAAISAKRMPMPSHMQAQAEETRKASQFIDEETGRPKPYTDAERARMAALGRSPQPEETAHG